MTATKRTKTKKNTNFCTKLHSALHTDWDRNLWFQIAIDLIMKTVELWSAYSIFGLQCAQKAHNRHSYVILALVLILYLSLSLSLSRSFSVRFNSEKLRRKIKIYKNIQINYSLIWIQCYLACIWFHWWLCCPCFSQRAPLSRARERSLLCIYEF